MNINTDYIISSAQRALRGLHINNLKAFFVSYDKNYVLKLYFYYQNKPSKKEKDMEGEIIAEMVADLPGIKNAETESSVLPYPSEIIEKAIQIFLK